MIPVIPLAPLLSGPFDPASPNALPVGAPPSAALATLRTDGEGQVIWGSLDSQTANTSIWSFVRYQISPDQGLLTSRGFIVDTEMDTLPENNPDYEWFRGASFGQSFLTVGPPSFLNLKSTVASPDLYYSFYYQRVEPFLNNTTIFDLDARFLLDYGTQGTGDARIALQDTVRYVELATLLYADPLGNRIRRIINNPSLSFAGLIVPTDSTAWASSGFILATPYERVLNTRMSHPLGAGYFAGTLDPYITPLTGTISTAQTSNLYAPTVRMLGTSTRFEQEINPGDFVKTDDGRTFTVSVVSSQERMTFTTAPTTPISDSSLYTTPYADTNSRITEARLKMTTYPAIAGNVDTGAYFSGKANGFLYTVSLQVVGGAPAVRLLQNGPGSASLLTVFYNWNDDDFHSYRVWADASADNLTLSIDDVVVGAVALSAFAATLMTEDVRFGHANGSSTIAWETLSHIWVPPLSAIRTLGVWLGGDRNNIDNWKLPRTDSTLAPNSSTSAIIYAMDWTSPIEVRVHRDPTFGVSVYRPDLISAAVFPPTWTGTPQFNSEYTDPTLAWINVEETRLPAQEGEVFGSVAFGSIDPQSICYQSWDYVRYRLYQWPDVDTRSPEHHVLNHANQIGSTELFGQTETETLVVESLDNRTVSFIPTDIYAQSVYRVIDGNTLISANYWTFDPQSQTVQLGYDADGFPVTFSSDHAAVTLVFVPGTPVTSTYLASVPLLQTATLLNEGTPPFVLQQAEDITRSVVAGGIVVDPTTGGFIDNTPYSTLDFTAPFSDIPPIPPAPAPPPQVESIYQDVTVYTITNEAQQNLIAICDDSLATIDFSGEIAPNTVAVGPQFQEYGPIPHEPPWAQAGLFPAGPTSTTGVLRLSGGPSTVGLQNDGMGGITVWSTSGTLGPAGLFVLAPTKGQGINQQVFIYQNGVPLFP